MRPYGVFGNNDITIWGHDGEANYHSLQTQFISRFGRGSQFQASYTWSKSTGTVPLDDSGGISGDNSVTDLTNPRLDYGPTRMNRPHIFNASLVLMLPTLENKSGFVKHVFGDWEIATIVAGVLGPVDHGLHHGPPRTSTRRPGRATRRTSGRCACPASRARPSGGPKEQILNPAAFTLTGYPARHDRRRRPRHLRRAPTTSRWTSRSTRTSTSASA